jgi:mono/diheme cytochrome c family protein
MYKDDKFAMRSISILFTVGAVMFSGLALASGNADKGKALYAQQCASCHGAGGKGDGPAAAALNPKPMNFTDKARMTGMKDQQLFDAIKKGGAGVGKSPIMPGFGAAMKDENIQDVVAFLRSLGK